MTAPALPFTRGDFDRRTHAVPAAMATAGLDAVFVSDPANMAWLTGYDGHSFYMHQGVILPLDGPPVWWGRAQDTNGAKLTVWMDEAHITSYGEHYVQSTHHHPMQDLAEKLSGLGLSGTRIGVEMDSFHFTGKSLESLRESLPRAQLVDATSFVNWRRAVKSDEELAFMRKAGRISEKIIRGIMDRVEPGMPKSDLVAEIYRDGIQGVDGAWGDYPAIVPLLPSGREASATHLTWDGKPFKDGEATFFEISGCHRRYHAPFCRTVFLGEPPKDLLEASDAVVAGLDAAIDTARAGNRAADIANAIKSAFRKAGIERAGRVGYPIGLAYPPDWGERTISIREEDETVLEAGMTFHVMPGLWSSDWGLEITESIVVRDGEPAEILVDYPRELVVKR